MDDIDESTSEKNIMINAINSFVISPHQIDKNAYHLTIVKDAASNSYRSQIRFNMHPLPFSYYTFVNEFFNASATTFSIHS